MERINWIDQKTNEEVLRTVREKRTLIDAIKERRWKMVGHVMRHPEELHNIILEGMIEFYHYLFLKERKLQDVPETPI
jgi:hypothetical protein